MLKLELMPVSRREPTDPWPLMCDLLRDAAHAYPDRDALVSPFGRMTYAELLAATERIAVGLLDLGVKPGDNIGLLMPNSFEFVQALFAASMVDAVAVPINARYRQTELQHVIAHAEVVTILTSDVIADHVDFTRTLTAAFPALAQQADPTDIRIDDAPALRSAVMLQGRSRPGFLGSEEFMNRVRASSAVLPTPRVGPSDTAMILYTSGTTARPKGCMLSHEAVSRGGFARMYERLSYDGRNVSWSGGPLFHIGSMQALLACIAVAGTYLLDTHFDPVRALRMLEEEKATTAWVWFPTIMRALLDDPSFEIDRLGALTTILLTWPPALIADVARQFPWASVVNVCGMTEMAGVYALTPPGEPTEARALTGGLPLDGIDVRIADPVTGETLPPGSVGELLARGYLRTRGYFRAPELTAAAIDADGWLHTQDLYEQTEDSRLIFRGRLKDLLKVGGESVAAVEVESLIAQHPSVKIVEVVGKPDARLDEVVVAFVELRPGHEETASTAIIDYCREKIARYKIPTEVHVMVSDDWPMSSTKVDKNRLRQYVRGETEAGFVPTRPW